MAPLVRPRIRTFLLCALTCLPLSSALSARYLACPLQKSNGTSALTGCPDGTLYVSATDPKANFTTVQDAVLSLYVMTYLHEMIILTPASEMKIVALLFLSALESTTRLSMLLGPGL